MKQAFIALGSNLGNRRAYLRRAINNLPDVVKVSRLYETDPVGYDDQDAFLNMVVQLETDLSPQELLEICQEQETLADRQREIVNGPRTVDLDVLWVEGEEVNNPDLIVPHPRMFERGFVMFPLNDLNPEITKDWMVENVEGTNPGGKSIYPGIYLLGELDLNEPRPIPILTIKDTCSNFLITERRQGKSIGLVPTMGALHKGHLNLIRQSKAENDLTLVTIFVNPLQFNEPVDLNSYPQNMDRDLEALELSDVDFIFMPSQDEMYPQPTQTQITIGTLTSELEGQYRPGHLEGVAVVVTKLLSIAGPCRAYFGEKDYQQLMVVRRLVSDLNIPADIIACSTVRESDGLALSSRNILLGLNERGIASNIFRALDEGRRLVEEDDKTDPNEVVEFIKKQLSKSPEIELEYVEIRKAEDFSRPMKIDAPVRILIAVEIGGVRLIDNIGVSP